MAGEAKEDEVIVFVAFLFSLGRIRAWTGVTGRLNVGDIANRYNRIILCGLGK